MTDKSDLVILLEERTLSNMERRRKRIKRIPISVVTEAVRKARDGEPLTEQEYIATHCGFLPGEKIPEVRRNLPQDEETK